MPNLSNRRPPGQRSSDPGAREAADKGRRRMERGRAAGAPLGLQPGDAVKVKGLRGEFFLTSWREESGGLVANVVGGTQTHRMFRSVTADRVQRGSHRREMSDVR